MLSLRSEMRSIEQACEVKLHLARQREDEIVKELAKREEASKKLLAQLVDVRHAHGGEIEHLNRKIAALISDKTTRQQLSYEAEALYSRCQLLED